MAACPSCGSENADTAKFCSECGAALALPPAGTREERKVVTVVFVDLVGSTARAEASDPEDVRALLSVYHERAKEQLESFGGTVEKFIGDAVVAVFGAPASHEDDPERAVRAALAVREAVTLLNEEAPDRDLHVRIAVNTGEALVSLGASPDKGEAMVAGDVVNTAARLQSAAPVDGILVGDQTYRATDREIVYRDADPVEAKGKGEPIPVHEAVEARSRLGVDLGGAGHAELVGRDAERDLLVAALTRSRSEVSTQLVTLVGVPGIGKSRLVYELGRVVDADSDLITWRQGRSLPYGEGVAFWALGEIVKAQAGILESDAASVTEAKLGEAVAVVGEPGERAWVERHLRPLVGLGGDELTGDRRGEAFAAWRRFLEAIAERGPTVVVFEDLHWADGGLLDFVDNLVDWVDGVALLVVCTARPELLDRRPGWGGGKRNATTVSLAPLADEETTRLVHALLERPLLDADQQRALVERAAGNPLYAEEFVRMLAAGASLEGELPETVQGIVAARIDLLPPEEKELLQDAAVLGKVFWSDALVSLGAKEPWQLTETLRSLERKEFVRREHRSAVAGATQHVFMHALVRDTVYGQLPRHARAERHLAAAEWIESLPEDRSEDRAETLAHHYLTAIELRRAAREDVAGLGERAVDALREAGERSLALGSFGAAARFLSSALELLPEGSGPSPDLLLAAGIAFGRSGGAGDELERAVAAFEAVGEYERAAEAAVGAATLEWFAEGSHGSRSWLDHAASLLHDRPPSRAKALVLTEQARRAMLSYHYETALELTAELLELDPEIADDEIRAHALVTRGACVVNTGRGREGVELLEEGIRLAGGRGYAAARGYTNLGVALSVLGDTRASTATFEAELARAQREGDEAAAWFTRGNLVGARYASGAWDDALEEVAALLDAPDAFQYNANIAYTVRADISSARGDPAGALRDAEACAAFARRAGDTQVLAPSLVGLARIGRRAGAADAARAALDEAVEIVLLEESAGDVQEWHVVTVMELAASGRDEEAAAVVQRMVDSPWREACAAIGARDYVAAAELLASIGILPLEAELRLLGASALADEGRLAEAESQLELARTFFHRVGATAYLREADEVLAAAS
jgi:class 3 adenylate cyclase/tetratricopeptide (TPR) repeat protein